ncbi:FtsX-like permease family protein [Streptomyces xylophagus]|uniref:FtsX-like permease family protein n=1 Tax=Streptomyces xylophagus TaxID=285514 RepID=UPI000AFE8C78|nr:FtsX-like permease family protein [Streptomyces xylophagus]
MLILILSSLRTRWVSLLGSFVAVALGVAVMASTVAGLASAVGASGRAPERFASSPVVVMGRDTLTVEVRRGPSTARVSKKLAHPHPVDNQLLADLRALGPVKMDGGGRRDAVGVDAPVGAVRAVVGGRARVLTGSSRRLADPAAARDAQQLVSVVALLGTAAGVTGFVSAFVTASTFAFVIALRRRELGLLRMAGATPGQVRRTLLGEAGVVGVVASAAGCALGVWAAPWLVRALVEGGVAPTWFTLREEVRWPYEVAFGAGVLVALTGAWTGARRAGRVGPAEALREAAVDTGVLPWSRRLIGGLLLAAGLALLARSLWTDPADLLKRKTYTTQPMILITAVAALAPALVGPVVRLLVRLPGACGLLIRENAATSVRRTAAVAAPVLVTVALAGSLLGSAWTVAGARAAEARERTRAQIVVTGEGLKVPGVPGVSGVSGAAGVPGIPGAVVSASASTAVFVREGGTALIRSDARAVRDVRAFAEVTRLPVVAGDVRELDDRSIVVNEEWERHTVGTWVRVWLGDGRATRLRIVAVLARGTGDNGAYVTAANAAGAGVDRLDVRVRDGGAAERARVVAELRASGGTVRSAGAWLAEAYPRMGVWGGGGGQGGDRTRLGLFVVLGISLIYGGISLATTLLMAMSARGVELRSLRLAGATRVQVLGVVVGEAIVAVGAVSYTHLTLPTTPYV